MQVLTKFTNHLSGIFDALSFLTDQEFPAKFWIKKKKKGKSENNTFSKQQTNPLDFIVSYFKLESHQQLLNFHVYVMARALRIPCRPCLTSQLYVKLRIFSTNWTMGKYKILIKKNIELLYTIIVFVVSGIGSCDGGGGFIATLTLMLSSAMVSKNTPQT